MQEATTKKTKREEEEEEGKGEGETWLVGGPGRPHKKQKQGANDMESPSAFTSMFTSGIWNRILKWWQWGGENSAEDVDNQTGVESEVRRFFLFIVFELSSNQNRPKFL
jgi:hypothetical protein